MSYFDPIVNRSNERSNGITIWVVEDNKEFSRNVRLVLLEEPRVGSCEEFGSAEDVLSAARQGMVADLVLLDIGLPGIDGLSALKQLKKLLPAMKAMILTVFMDDEQIFKAVANGADGYLLKSSSMEEIQRSVSDVMNGGFPINPYIAKRIILEFNALNHTKSDYGLSDRERKVLEYLVEGIPRLRISEHLHISHHTVDFHIRNIYTKLQVKSQSDAVAKSLRERIV